MEDRTHAGQGNTVLLLRPSVIYAVMATVPLIVLSYLFLFAAAWLFTPLCLVSAWLSIAAMLRYIRIACIRYTLSSETLVVRSGLFARRYEFLELYRVKDFTVNQSAVMRVAGISTITLHTTDKTDAEVTLEGLPDINLAGLIRELVQEARRANRIIELN